MTYDDMTAFTVERRKLKFWEWSILAACVCAFLTVSSLVAEVSFLVLHVEPPQPIIDAMYLIGLNGTLLAIASFVVSFLMSEYRR